MRRLLLLLLINLLFVAPSFSQKREVYKVKKVVIDPGHGGAKPGAMGARSQEKQITLAIAKKFGKLIEDNYSDVKVIYTRTTDVDISLAERARIANRAKADLFISIHANSHPTSSPTGVETFVMGLSESRANLEVAKKENADILLEADYKENKDYEGFDPNAPESSVILMMFQNAYMEKSLNFAQAIQNQYRSNLKTINRGVKQAELFVLYKTAMPSVLTEVGFISNPTEEAFMMSEEGQTKIALCLFNAFMNYKSTEEGSPRIANPVININGHKNNATEPTKTQQPSEVAQVAPPAQKTEEQKIVVEQPKVPATTNHNEVKPIEKKTVEAKPAEVKEVAEAPKTEAPKTAIKPVEKQQEATTIAKEKQQQEQHVAQRPLPSVSLQPREQTAVSQPAPQQLAAPQQPTATQPVTAKTITPPVNTAKNDAQVYYAVQFATSPCLFQSSDPEMGGMQNLEYYKNSGMYCYTVGRFATYQDASRYCSTVQQETEFKDAWVVSRRNAIARPQDTDTPAPKTTTTTTPKKTTTTATRQGKVFTVQFATIQRRLKAGDPDLGGIRDFRVTPSGRFFIYTAGRYATREEAEARCNKIRNTTPFKDAVVIEVNK